MSAFKYLMVSPLLLLTACQEPTVKPEPSIQPPAPQSTANVIVADTPASIPPASVGLKKVDFPVQLDGIPSLLHPIMPSVPLDAKDTKSDYLTDSRKGDTPTSYFQQISPYQFQSSIYNLVFEDIATGTTKRLFPHDNYLIKSVVYPFIDLKTTKPAQNTPADNPEAPAIPIPPTIPEDANDTASTPPVKKMLHHFIYEVKEQPNDDNSKTNIDEQLALYLSDDTGSHLVKLHPNNQYVKAVKWLPAVARYYFTTQADTNGDKLIDANDKTYNYVIDFANPVKKTDKNGKVLSEQPKILTYTFLN